MKSDLRSTRDVLVAVGLALAIAGGACVALVGRADLRELDRSLAREASAAASLVTRADGGVALPELPSSFVGVVYDEHGSPRAGTAGFLDEAPRSGVLHPRREPFDLVRGAQDHAGDWRAVMAPVPDRPGAYLLVASQRSALAPSVVAAIVASFGAAWLAIGLAVSWLVRRLARRHEAEIGALGVELETQKRFVAFAAHELRAPLTLVHGQLALALRRPRQVDEYRSAIGEALDAASHLRSLTEDLLSLERARDPGGAAPRSATPIALARVIRSAARHVQVAAQSRRVVVEMRVPPVFVLGRAADLERLARNLLENAVRHSPSGGRIVVEASLSSDRADRGDRVALSIQDEGSGVPVCDRERVFEPFYRGAVAEDGTGAGLGLAIARAIARAHGGDVIIDGSAPGGARFVVHLRAFDGEPQPSFVREAEPTLDLS